MKKILAALVLVMVMAGSAAALTDQQAKMKECNLEAKQKSLSGAAREAFMKDCLSTKPAVDAKQLTPQQQKMKTCNVEASQKQLKGAERKAFMSTCLSAK